MRLLKPLLLLVALVIAALLWRQQAPAPPPDAGGATPHATLPGASHPLPPFLPPEAADTLARIAHGGPFEHRQDGIVFNNREGRLPAMMRLLIAESHKFPDLARVWHDEVVSRVLGLVTAAIERAQARGEVRPGNARLYAFSIVGPMLASALFREVFRDTAPLPDLAELAAQHAQTVLQGMLLTDEP